MILASEESNPETKRLRERLRRLANDKASLQLIIHMIGQITPMAGLENLVTKMLSTIVDGIGGTNIKLYYYFEKELHYADFLGERHIKPYFDDPLVARVAATLSFVEQESDLESSLLHSDAFQGSWNWGFPLVVGEGLVGVVKIENIQMSGTSLSSQLPPFFSHVALILSNEIHNETEKKKKEETRQRAQEAEQARQAMLFLLEDMNESGEAVKHAKEEWEATFDAVSDPIFLHDRDFRIVRANRAYAESAGMSIGDVIGHPYWEVFPKGDGPMPNCVKAGEKAEEEEEEEEINTSDGRFYLSHSYAINYENGVRSLSIHFMQDITARRLSEIQRDEVMAVNQQQLVQLKENLKGTIEAVAKAVEARDPYTAGHQRRVASLAVLIGRQMGLDDEGVLGLYLGAAIHDIGKIRLPSEILSKPTQLRPVEYALIKTHPQIGYDILKGIEFPWPVADIAHQHHERLDGSGYPQGLHGDDICFEAKIVAVADVMEAMASDRPYRAGLGVAKAMKELNRNKGVFYQPEVVDACEKVVTSKKFDLITLGDKEYDDA